jgi:transcriptional regulator with XRE-family HTH domain
VAELSALGRAVKERRQELGLTQVELGKRLGVHSQTVSRYETGDIDLTVARVREIAVALETTPKALFDRASVELIFDPANELNEAGDEIVVKHPQWGPFRDLADAVRTEEALGFAARARQAREKAGLNLPAAAKALGWAEGVLVEWERGTRQPSLDDVQHMGMMYGVSLDWLLNGKGSPERQRVVSVQEPRIAQNLPYNIRVFLEEFRLRITKGGATEEEVDRAMQLLRSPSLFTWYSSGTPRELPEAKVLQSMKVIAESVIVPELRARGRDV